MKVMKTLAVLLLAVLAVTAALRAKPYKNDQRIRNNQNMYKPRVEASRGMEVEVKTLKRRVEMLEKGSAKGKMDDKTIVYLKKSIASLEKSLKEMEKKAQKDKKKYEKEEKEVLSFLTSQSKGIKNLNKRLGKMEKTVSEKGDDLMKGVAYLKKEVKELQKKVDKLEEEKKKVSATVQYGQLMQGRHNYQDINPYAAPATQSQNATNTSVTVTRRKPHRWNWFGDIFSHLGKMQGAVQVNATNNATTSQYINIQPNVTTSSTKVRGRNGRSSWWEQRQTRRNSRKQKWGKQKVIVNNKRPGFKKTYVYVPTVKQTPMGMKKYVVTNGRQMYQKVNNIAQPSQQTQKVETKPTYTKKYTYTPAAQQQSQQVEEKKEAVEEKKDDKKNTAFKALEEDKWLENAVQNGAAAMKWLKKNRKNIDEFAKTELAQVASQVAEVPSTDKDVTNVVSSTVNVATNTEGDDGDDDDVEKEKNDDDDDEDGDSFFGGIFSKVKKYF